MRYCSELEASVTSDKKSNELSTGKKKAQPQSHSLQQLSLELYTCLSADHTYISYIYPLIYGRRWQVHADKLSL